MASSMPLASISAPEPTPIAVTSGVANPTVADKLPPERRVLDRVCEARGCEVLRAHDVIQSCYP